MSDLPGSLPAKKKNVSDLRHQARSRSFSGEEDNDYEDAGQSAPGCLVTWLPLAAGIALGIFAPRLYRAIPFQTEWQLWFVFPYVVLFQRPESGLSAEMRQSLSQLALMLQFPIDGLLFSFSLSRRISAVTAFLQVVFLHFLGAFVLWLLSQPRQ